MSSETIDRVAAEKPERSNLNPESTTTTMQRQLEQPFGRRQIARRPRLCRFIKSYKYKHKQEARIAGKYWQVVKVEIKFLPNCDSRKPGKQQASSRRAIRGAPLDSISCLVAGRQQSPPIRQPVVANQLGSASLISKCMLTLALASLAQHLFPLAQAFCPSVKCVCDDRLLSANCTSVPSISHIPITLNPLLKRETTLGATVTSLNYQYYNQIFSPTRSR